MSAHLFESHIVFNLDAIYFYDVLLIFPQAYLFGHMPPGFVEPTREFVPKCLMSDDSNARYLRMVENYADIISGQFFGHLHTDTFRVFYNSSGKYRNPALPIHDFQLLYIISSYFRKTDIVRIRNAVSLA